MKFNSGLFCETVAILINISLGSATTTTKKATWSWSVVFFHTRPDTTIVFFGENGRVGRGRGLVVHLVVFWSYFGRVWSCFFTFRSRFYGFSQDFLANISIKINTL